jgi:hypothetical protein
MPSLTFGRHRRVYIFGFWVVFRVFYFVSIPSGVYPRLPLFISIERRMHAKSAVDWTVIHDVMGVDGFTVAKVVEWGRLLSYDKLIG